MDFALSHEQKMLVDTVRGFIADELAPLEQKVEDEGKLDDATAKSIFAKSSELGLYAIEQPHLTGPSL